MHAGVVRPGADHSLWRASDIPAAGIFLQYVCKHAELSTVMIPQPLQLVRQKAQQHRNICMMSFYMDRTSSAARMQVKLVAQSGCHFCTISKHARTVHWELGIRCCSVCFKTQTCTDTWCVALLVAPSWVASRLHQPSKLHALVCIWHFQHCAW